MVQVIFCDLQVEKNKKTFKFKHHKRIWVLNLKPLEAKTQLVEISSKLWVYIMNEIYERKSNQIPLGYRIFLKQIFFCDYFYFSNNVYGFCHVPTKAIWLKF